MGDEITRVQWWDSHSGTSIIGELGPDGRWQFFEREYASVRWFPLDENGSKYEDLVQVAEKHRKAK